MASILTACGTVAENADVGLNRTWLDPKKTITDTAKVEIVETGPALSSKTARVSGYSCRNKMWDDPPSKENAIALMKQQAEEKGFTHIHSVQVVGDPGALIKNCWEGLIATGIAFNP